MKMMTLSTIQAAGRRLTLFSERSSPRSTLRALLPRQRLFQASKTAILRLHFCVWTDAEHAWIKRDVWEACEDSTLSIDAFADQPCWAGLDLSSTKDLTA